MKNVKTLAVSAMILVLTLAGCSQGTGSSKTAEAGSVTTLRLGHIQNEEHAWHLGSKRFAKLVEEKTNGSVEVDLYPSSTLGSDRDLVEGMQIGSVDFALVAGVLSNFHPEYAILELPYLFENNEHLRNFLYGEGGENLQADMLEQTGVRGLEFFIRSPRLLTANKRVETPEDLSGVKIRVPNIEASVEGWDAMGANPTPMNFSEVYSSLQTGVIDAQENPASFITNAKLQEVQDYLMMTEHVYGYVQLLMSDKTYEKLTVSEQKAVEEAALEARKYQNELVSKQQEEAMQTMREAGMEIVEVDRSLFSEKVQTVNKKLANKYGRELYDEIVEMRE
ncbi:TRAP transporter substrate-binding protein [Salibacterium halotolerans]|uniref:Tripartite ATP-independent transporter solute receptor, DctP family n=1 Tax=Salibacterium halotolerans TaxID=1884432 RepID=A0A1I5KYD8_9BACI|nr:TRAP transporter substrate-binding protein [Salibacterium halotolerans]SFO89933.1 tripartite ATP-independent transporter solute receptor, DctP family [Salibacterium halotolerans]